MADNLLDKASILLTPTAHNDGSMLSVKPENGDGDFTFSRSSAATRVNAQGLVENVQIISSELVSNGNFSQIGTEEVSNGNFSQEGSELITNGDFSNGLTNWSVNGGSYATIVDGALNSNNTENGSWFAENVSQDVSFVTGKTYKIFFKARNISGDSNLRITHQSHIVFSNNLTSSFVDYTIYYTAQANNDSIRIFCNDAVGQFQIDNVSVKEVGQDWSLGTGWSVDQANSKVIGDGTSFTYITQSPISIQNKKVKLTFDISDYVSGTFRLLPSDRQDGLDERFSGNGSYEVVYISTLDTFRFQQQAFNGSITNISVKEVGQDWTFGSGWSVDQANSKATCDGTQTSTSTLQTAQGISNIQNDLVKLSFEIKDYSAGAVSVTLQGTGGIEFNNLAANGVYEINVTSTDSLPRLLFNANSSFVGSVTNISVKEITDDTDLPRINYEGFSYQDSLGSEEVVNGDFATDSNWSLGNWTIENNTVTIDGQSGILSQATPPLVAGKKYKWTFEITEYISGSVKLYSGGGGDAATYENSVGTHTQYFVANGTGKYFYSNSFNGSIDNVSVKEYLGQEVVPDSGCGSWLLEPQSTNLVIESEALSTMQTQSTITDNNLLSPTGDVNASLVVENTATNHHGIKKSNIIPTNANAVDYTISVFAKKKERQFVQFQLYAGSTQYNSSFFDLENGTTSGDASTHKIEDYGNGWYRCSFTDSVTQSTGGFNFAAAYMSQSSTSYYTGDGASGIYMFGFQLEQQSYATSYIPTNGATNTRLQDIATNSGNSTLINSTEGVLYGEGYFEQTGLTNGLFAISDGTFNNFLMVRYSPINKLQIESTGGVNIIESNARPSGSYKIAVKYNSSGVELWVNGSKIDETSTQSTMSGINQLMVGKSPYGNIVGYKNKALAVYKEALTDAQLQSLTTI